MASTAGQVARSRPVLAAIVCLLLAGAVQLALGIAAISGATAFEDNVFEIESNEDFGRLYFSLETWGAISAILGIGQLAGAAALLRRTPSARLAALVAAYFGLAGAFFALAIFRGAAVALIVIQLAGIVLLSYFAGRPSSSSESGR